MTGVDRVKTRQLMMGDTHSLHVKNSLGNSKRPVRKTEIRIPVYYLIAIQKTSTEMPTQPAWNTHPGETDPGK